MTIRPKVVLQRQPHRAFLPTFSCNVFNGITSHRNLLNFHILMHLKTVLARSLRSHIWNANAGGEES